MARGTVFREARPGSWFQNSRGFVKEKVGGATVVRLTSVFVCYDYSGAYACWWGLGETNVLEVMCFGYDAEIFTEILMLGPQDLLLDPFLERFSTTTAAAKSSTPYRVAGGVEATVGEASLGSLISV